MKRLLAVVLVLGALGNGRTVDASDSLFGESLTFTVDVSEDFSRFVPTPVTSGDTEPRRGSWFLTEGNIFPAGTIQGDGGTFDPRSAGSIGTWLCKGTHLISLAEILAGGSPWVTTTQTYLAPGIAITTEGLEGVGTFVRAVTGATGPFDGFVGEQRQRLLGFNPTGGVNLRVTFVLRRASR